MSATEIHQRARRHNCFQVFLGVVLVIVSLFLWFASFWFLRFATSLPFDLFDLDGRRIGFYIAMVGIIVLIFEGVRYAGPLLWSRDYAESENYDNFLMPRDHGSILNINIFAAGFGTASMLLSQAICAAPRTTVDGIIAFLSRVPSDLDTAGAATRILGELREHRKWVSASHYEQSATALVLLERLDLIWVERDGEFAEIRYPAGTR